ncbi:zinc-ribbon domain-containing protein [Robiginitalea marina]|uniref:Zinc ribbon domain-containing protein n=1 Tax=Robiginitalea marina TaxID=2954105 RepID=A0ABT1AXT8_9FLAO|nr:zinc-ribbon domain-containing protein [Robiginitalea marina]MCO5724749.1 zinc ribbon domain-containing protein [Robiginitalea marina]
MFILFFGTRPGKKKEATLPGAACPYCGQAGQLRATLIPQFVHLFWIPVFRLRPTAYVECGHCKKAYAEDDLTTEMRRGLDGLASP